MNPIMVLLPWGHMQHLIMADFEVALQLAAELDFLFENASFEEKRLICETVFKRIYLKEGTISDYELNTPFGLITCKGKGSGAARTGCRARIRTWAKGSKVPCATTTQLGNPT